METQVALVSAQPMPTLILAFQREPERVVLMTTDEMKGNAIFLKNVFNPKGIKVAIVPVASYDIQKIRDSVARVINDYDNVALNVTGGTKVMALGAFLEFSERKLPIFYVDMKFGLIRNLTDNSMAPLRGRVSLKEYLMAHGFYVESSEGLREVIPRKKIVSILAKTLTKMPGRITNWNHLFHYYTPHDNGNMGVESADRDLRDVFESLALESVGNLEKGRYTCDEEMRKYFLGGWLEDYVFLEVNALKPDSLAKNVVVSWESPGKNKIKNEFDILFTHNFKLYYISCKTSNITGGHEHSKEAIYELDALRDRIAGLFGKAMLATVRKLGEADFTRAKRMGVAVVQGKDLANLRSMIASWIKSR